MSDVFVFCVLNRNLSVRILNGNVSSTTQLELPNSGNINRMVESLALADNK